MISRRQFLQYVGAAPAFSLLANSPAASQDKHAPISSKLRPIGRALEREGYYVWCNSPIYGPDGTVHVFYSRWTATKGMGGWLNGSEIVHAALVRSPHSIRSAQHIYSGAPRATPPQTLRPP